MPRGKKAKKHSHIFRANIPKVAVLGHSMPRNLMRYLDTLIPGRSQNDIEFSKHSLGQKYSMLLGLDKLFSQVEFFHCATVQSPTFRDRIEQIAAYKPELVIFEPFQ